MSVANTNLTNQSESAKHQPINSYDYHFVKPSYLGNFVKVYSVKVHS